MIYIANITCYIPEVERIYTYQKQRRIKMEYLYEREKELKKEIKRLERDCFNPNIRPVLKELRARYDEIHKAIKQLEHE